MPPAPVAAPTADALKRRVLLTILVLSWVSSNLAWAIMESLGTSTTVLRVIFGLNVVFHPVMTIIAWRHLLPLRFVELACLTFAAGLCAACMALRFYAPAYGASIDLEPLYLWIPVIYVFAFSLPNHRLSLQISLAILGLYVAISLPSLLQAPAPPHANFTIQLHMVSAVLIAALYFFSSYLHRFQVAQLTVDELARLANTDELTKLANRRRMHEALVHELARYIRYEHTFSLIVIDIDHFKQVNDRHGHAVGDQCLVALAGRTREVLREVDTLGRWGGEEFLVILPETPFDETLHKASELCRHVAAAPMAGGDAVTVSCGVTSVGDGDTVESLLARADVALYAAKRHGRNRAEGVQGANPALSLATP